MSYSCKELESINFSSLQISKPYSYKKLQASLSSLEKQYSSIELWDDPIGICYTDIVSPEEICYQPVSGSLTFQINNSSSEMYIIVTVNESERIVIKKNTTYSLIAGNIYDKEITLLHTKYYIADNSM